jgi:hypothetical protein
LLVYRFENKKIVEMTNSRTDEKKANGVVYLTTEVARVGNITTYIRGRAGGGGAHS